MSKDLPSHIILGDTATGNEIADWLESLGLPVVHVSDLDGLAAVLPDYASASLIIDSSGDATGNPRTVIVLRVPRSAVSGSVTREVCPADLVNVRMVLFRACVHDQHDDRRVSQRHIPRLVRVHIGVKQGSRESLR